MAKEYNEGMLWRTSKPEDSPYYGIKYGALDHRQQEIHDLYSSGNVRVKVNNLNLIGNIESTNGIGITEQIQNTIEDIANEVLARRKGLKPMGELKVLQI